MKITGDYSLCYPSKILLLHIFYNTPGTSQAQRQVYLFDHTVVPVLDALL